MFFAACSSMVLSQTPETTLAKAEIAEPLALMGAAIELDRSGKKDEAVFWFYAGQLRARYSPQLKGENSQLVQIFMMVSGPVNAHAQRDILQMEKTIQRVFEWDEKSFAAWAEAHRLTPENAQLTADRAKARDGLTAMMEELKSKREHYEKAAREYKDPEMEMRAQQQEYAKRIRENFSTRMVERVIAGQTLHMPANYFSRTGLQEQYRTEERHLTLSLFLPGLEGFSAGTPLEFGSMRNLVWMRINDPNVHRNAAELFEQFIATQPKMVWVFGSKAYFFDVRNNPGKSALPLHGYMNEYVFVQDRPGRARTYMSCQAPESNIQNPNSRCKLFMLHTKSTLRVNAEFSQDYGNDWQRIADSSMPFSTCGM